MKLHYVAYAKENVIKAWSEISHNEKSPITLWRYSSTMLYFKSSKYYLTNYHSDWAKEGQPETTQLSTGKKIIDTKLGTRAAMHAEPFFELGFDEPAKENEGKVMLGTIGWPGNFRFTFEVDNVGALRVIPAINPYASDYKLKAGEVFTTPEFIFAIYVFGIVDRIMTENPDVAYFKWDCNSVITNIFSPYHKQNQGNFYIDHVRGLYNVLTRIHNKYPKLPMMLCSGGGGRMDYEMLKYFTEFWCSDDTDPYERLYIQWSLSKFFPAKTMGSHVTNWNKNTSVKFRTDVCSSCKLGFDIDLKSLSKDDYKFVQQAVKNYNSMKPVILEGDQYRLVSPYEGSHCAVNYVSKDKQRAVLFAYDLHPRYKEPQMNVKLQGLNPTKLYTVKETNLMPGKTSELECDGKQYSGDYLMKVGLSVFSAQDGTSHVLTLE